MTAAILIWALTGLGVIAWAVPAGMTALDAADTGRHAASRTRRERVFPRAPAATPVPAVPDATVPQPRVTEEIRLARRGDGDPGTWVPPHRLSPAMAAHFAREAGMP